VCCSSSLNPNPNPHPNPNPNPNPIQAGVLFLIAGLVQIIACIILLVQLVAAINHVSMCLCTHFTSPSYLKLTLVAYALAYPLSG